MQIIFSEDLLSHGKGLMGEFKFINMTFSPRRLNYLSDHGYKKIDFFFSPNSRWVCLKSYK